MEYDTDTMDYLGKGGFGEVYGINDRNALKVIHVGRDEHLRKATLNEIMFMLKLKMMDSGPGYDNILHIDGYREDPKYIYIEMPRASCSMMQFIEVPIYEHSKMSLPEKLAISRQCYSGLSFLHNNQIVHQDVKPDNVLFFGMTVKLCDFGLARVKSSDSTTLTMVHNLGGTLYYLSPEVHLEERPAQYYSDVWSMGVTNVEWITGKRAWHLPADKTQHRRIMREKKMARSMPDELVNVSDTVRDLLEVSLSYNPKARPTAAQIEQHLADLAGPSTEIATTMASLPEDEGAASVSPLPSVTYSRSFTRSSEGRTLVHSRDSGNGHSDVSVKTLRNIFEKTQISEPSPERTEGSRTRVPPEGETMEGATAAIENAGARSKKILRNAPDQTPQTSTETNSTTAGMTDVGFIDSLIQQLRPPHTQAALQGLRGFIEDSGKYIVNNCKALGDGLAEQDVGPLVFDFIQHVQQSYPTLDKLALGTADLLYGALVWFAGVSAPLEHSLVKARVPWLVAQHVNLLHEQHQQDEKANQVVSAGIGLINNCSITPSLRPDVRQQVAQLLMVYLDETSTQLHVVDVIVMLYKLGETDCLLHQDWSVAMFEKVEDFISRIRHIQELEGYYVYYSKTETRACTSAANIIQRMQAVSMNDKHHCTVINIIYRQRQQVTMLLYKGSVYCKKAITDLLKALKGHHCSQCEQGHEWIKDILT